VAQRPGDLIEAEMTRPPTRVGLPTWEAAIGGACAAASVVALVGQRPFVAFVIGAFGAFWWTAIVVRDRPHVVGAINRCCLLTAPGSAARVDLFTVAQWLLLMTVLAWSTGSRGVNPPPFSPIYDDHEWTSLDIAVTRAKCGALSSAPEQGSSVATYLSAHPEAATTPLISLATFTCASRRPLVISENTLMLIEAATLRVYPTASLRTIGRVLIALQALGLALFATALTVTGVPWPLSVMAMLAAIRFIDALSAQYAYAIYPLMLPSVLGTIGLLCLMPRGGTWRGQAAAGAGLGIWLAAVGNLRTDMLLICAVVVAVSSLVRRAGRLTLAAHAAGLLCGLMAFHIAWIRPIESTQPQRLTAHAIMHPIVLSLAVPDNALARQFGLRWNDTVGFDLAHRIEPGVNVLTGDYEAVLRRFYVQLWREHPGEMLNVYRHKFAYAARSFVVDTTGIGFDSQIWKSVMRPLSAPTSSGWTVPALLGLGVLAGIGLIRRWPESWILPLTLVVIAGTLNWLEAAFIFSRFTPQYYGVAFFAMLMCAIGLYQLAWQCSWWPMNRSALPTHSSQPASRT
jgi:hypothetical protein